jgi:DNA-binding response OmpR family regulator
LKKKILLVEDEDHLRYTLRFNLESEGYEVTEAANGLTALQKYEKERPFAAIVLDVQMPEMNGFEVAEKIRAKDDTTQILMLTARAADSDRIQGFKAGVDDYITKPFHLEELMLRIRRMGERAEIIEKSGQNDSPVRTVLSHGGLTLSLEELSLSYQNQKTELTSLEADCLAQFLSYPGEVLTRKHLLDKVWNISGLQETRTVDAFVVRLRKKLEEISCTELEIASVRGRGYCLQEL